MNKFDYEKKIQFLQSPQNWPEHTHNVQLIQTHMSVVFLTDQFAYKMKRPLYYAPADYRLLSQRKFACQEELRLNKVLASSVYLKLVPLYADEQDQLSFHVQPNLVEILIQMRRLRECDTLHQGILNRNWKVETTVKAAKKLVEFYRLQKPAPVTTCQYSNKLRSAIQENIAYYQTHSLEGMLHPAMVIANSLEDFLGKKAELFAERHSQVIEGHGDLRAEHIYLEDEPIIIDRLEFSADFRYVDILEDLALLSIDCESLGDVQPANIFLETYVESQRNTFPQSLWHFYRAHRAFTWSRLAAWHIDQVSIEQRVIWQEKAQQRLRIALQETCRAHAIKNRAGAI